MAEVTPDEEKDRFIRILESNASLATLLATELGGMSLHDLQLVAHTGTKMFMVLHEGLQTAHDKTRAEIVIAAGTYAAALTTIALKLKAGEITFNRGKS